MKICLKCDEVFSSDGWICSACGYEPARLNDMEVHAPEFANSGGGFKPEYFSELAQLESSNFWFQARNNLILWALHKYQPNASKLLEVGCGTGFVLSGISRTHPNIALSGTEIFLAGLSHAAKRVSSAHCMQMDARRVPFVEEFDAIGAFDVLEHIEEDEKVLAQLHGAIKPGGVLLLTVPQHPWLWSAFDDYACHVRRYTRKEIERKVFTAGFELLRSSSFVTSLLPVMMLSRITKKQVTKAFDPVGELKINAVLNKTFYALMMLELAGIKSGMDLPVGGSRLVVARRIASA
jgi:SAM-dependent methyltransferase